MKKLNFINWLWQDRRPHTIFLGIFYLVAGLAAIKHKDVWGLILIPFLLATVAAFYFLDYKKYKNR